MPLDSEFKKQTEKLVTETLELYKNAGASPRINDVWKCENIGDFLYPALIKKEVFVNH